MNFQAGFGKAEITCFIPGIGMMGYGQPHNTVKEVATPLWSRVMWLSQGNQDFLLIHLEQAFISMAIKEEILKRLERQYPGKFQHANVLITAQHTHSAPGGYSHYPMYNFTIPGFQLRVFQRICDGIMQALQSAQNDIMPVTLSYGEHEIAADKEVAFNRSMQAHLNNPDSLNKESHLAVDRRMQGLMVKDLQGNVKALLNWFGVHCTSVSSFNHRIHHDNKGVAAALFEKNHPGTMAFFMQAAAGDVSPNYIWDQSLGRTRGKFKDQYESTEFNGEIQFREAEKIEAHREILGSLRFIHQFVDMSLRAAPAAHGVAFFLGPKEGPGIPTALGAVLKGISRGVRKAALMKESKKHKAFYEAHDPKDVLLDHRSGSFLGISLNAWKKFPKIPDATVEGFRKCASEQSLETLPWVPHVLPFQLISLGPVLIVAVPGEITTIAAARLKARMAAYGHEEIIIASYANAYMGYVTTPEEYVTQSYEAGHTVYGRHTLRGFIQSFEELGEALKLGHPTTLGTHCFHFPEAELKRRSVE